MASKLDIPLHGASANIVRQCRSALTEVLHSKFGCMATIEGVGEGEPSNAQQRRPTVDPEKRFAVALPSGVEVSVWKADLTSFKVDAVVNAANTYLGHYGGLAFALSKAGGPQIQSESSGYINRHGDLSTGDAVVMDAGFLPCKKIIHAVGPELFRNPPKSDVSAAEPLLEKAVRNILDRVRENHLQSVAIPAISSGLFHFPLPLCANIIVTTVKRYYEHRSGYLPKKVMLVNHDEPTVREMERACRQILAPHMPLSYSQAAAGSSRGDARASALTVQIGNIRLTLKKGKIEEQQTDVIVNTTFSRKLDGQISKAVLHKAGYGMQREVEQAPPTGNVIITKPYKLQCKQVFHMFWSEMGKTTEPQRQTLYSSVLDCLHWAATYKHKSIAFPAIGTGGLGIGKKEAAQVMADAVDFFALSINPNLTKTDVYFVIFPSDQDTFEAFEEQMRRLQQRASGPPGFPSAAHEHRADHHGSRARSPQISLIGPSNEAVREADRWLQRLLFQSSGSISIWNNFIQHFGEEEQLQLSHLVKKGVSIEECFVKGRAGIIINGRSAEDVVATGLEVEAMLCGILREFVTEEERFRHLMSTENVPFERKTVDFYAVPELSNRLSAFSKQQLRVVKVEKVENPALKEIFDLKKNQIRCNTPRRMFQRIPAQFCEAVCRIGFHAEYAPPKEPAYGEGIYFAGSVKSAMEVWEEPDEEYLYFVEADVLTGNSTPGKPGLILPPAAGTQPNVLYDSVSGGADISVIFSGYQALPRYIITCKSDVESSGFVMVGTKI